MALCHRSRCWSSVRGGSFSTGGTLSTSSGKNAYTRVLRLPSLREHVQKHTACRFDSPLWQAPSWTEVANGYLDLTQWGPPPWTELQWVTLRNVIELAEDS